MRLNFTVNQDNQRSVQIIDSKGNGKVFSYIELVKQLHSEKLLEETTIDDGYTEEEKTSINTLVCDINDVIKKSEATEDQETLDT